MTSFGPYEILGELGRGAMARVWRAWDPNLEREVAIKEPMFDQELPAEALENLSQRFVQEAVTAARLNHPGIVTVYAADVYDGRPAIVMELVDGSTLDDFLASSGSLTPSTALDVLDQLLDAVGYAHSQGVVHRDIKPANIFVNSAGRVKLADFGIAHVDDSLADATLAGAVMGTPGYMSPEQARGAEVDGRSDLFSVGVVGYEMLTGVNPFGLGDGADQTTLLYRIVNEPAPELPESVGIGMPEGFRPAIMASLSKSPDARPQDAAAFKALLHGNGRMAETSAFDTRADWETQSSSPSSSASSSSRWLPFALLGVGAVVAVVLVFAAMSGTGGGGGGGGSGKSGGTSGNSPASASEPAKQIQVPGSSSSTSQGQVAGSATSASKSGSSSASKGASFAGAWILTSTTQGDETIGAEDIALLRESGVEYSVDISSSGSVVLTLGDKVYSGTWTAYSEDTGSMTVEGEYIEMQLSGTQLVLTGENSTLTFERE